MFPLIPGFGNYDRFTNKKPSNILGKNPLPISTIQLLLLVDYIISPFPQKLASHNSMQKKNDKVGNKSEYKKEMKKGEKRVRKKIKIDLPKKSPNFGL